MSLEAVENLKNQLLSEPEGEESNPEKEEAKPEETENSSESSEEQPKEEQEQEKEQVKLPEKVKLTVNGKEVEVPFEELKKGYSMTAAANQKFQEAAALRKEAEELKKSNQEVLDNIEKVLSEKPIDFLKNYFGDNYEKIADMIAKEQTAHHEKLLKMSPEQRAEHEFKKQLEREKQEKAELLKKLEEKDNLDSAKEKELYKKEIEAEFESLSKKYPYVEEILPDIKQVIAWRVANSDDPEMTIESEYKKEAARLAHFKKEKFENLRNTEKTVKNLSSQKNVAVPEKKSDLLNLKGRERIEAYKRSFLS